MKNKDQEIMELRFPKLNHFWLDSGLLGLYRISEELGSSNWNVTICIGSNEVVFKGSVEDIEALLNENYQALLKRYYNKSTQKQIQENAGFYYDSENDHFVRFPKVYSSGIAGLIFSKPARPSTDKGIDFKSEKIKGKKKVYHGQLPDSLVHLQQKLDNFLEETGLTATTSELLVDGPNAIQPLVNICVNPGKIKGKCFFCGESSHSLSEVGGTVFPFIAGSAGGLGFASMAEVPEKVCWKCDYVSKFVPVNGFFMCNDGGYQIFLPYSTDLKKMNGVYGALHAAEFDDPFLMRNFDHPLGWYFQKPYELTMAFLYTLYVKVLSKKRDDSNEDSEYELDFEKLFEIVLSNAPLEFFVVL